MQSKRYFPFSIFLILTFSFVACKHQEVIKNKPVEHAGFSIEELRDSMACHPVNFRKLSFKGTGQTEGAENGMNFSFNYKLRIAKDSLLWCSITKFSLEFMQGIVSKDSMKMRTLQPSEARVCDMSWMSSKLGFTPTLPMFEALLTGRPWLEGDSVELVNGLKPPYEIRKWENGFSIMNFLDSNPVRLTKMIITYPGKQDVSTVLYSDFQESTAGILPHHIGFSVERNKQLSTFTLDHVSITVNGENTTFDFRIPSGIQVKHCDEK